MTTPTPVPASLPNSDDALLLIDNPACSKCRAAKQLLEARGLSFAVRPYLEQPLTREELAELGRRLALPARAWLRAAPDAWAEQRLDENSTDEQILDAMAAEPALIQRPILVRGMRAMLGRPPEALLKLLP